ncbi:DMT family transporter [Roseovarius aestuariivivens]|uniref:DMT family transporter n=1 Tax=Roseovarius aestuariivivens TaxID=1888910 RepID=UPI001080D91D|nr:DMT family transporter [Roseovarius aestuariivivens]
MPQATLLASLIITIGGALIAMQAPINSMLARQIESSVAAACISFGVGFVVLLGITLAYGDGASLPRVGAVPKWLLVGGALGAVFVWSSLWAVPILGVLTTTTLLILGQMTASLAIDHFGAFGLLPREISLPRVMAAVLVAAGAVLSRF